TAESLAAADGAKLVVYSCGHHAPAALWGGTAQGRPAGTTEIYLPSMSRLDVADVVHAFESGAQGVLVLACESGSCRYPEVDIRLTKRVEQARKLMSEVGVAPEKIGFVMGAAGNADATTKAIADMAVVLSGAGAAEEA
ncbi:MAG: hydrogenase iron-sulfur subunit, partial [Planctomycetota bacterium]